MIFFITLLMASVLVYICPDCAGFEHWGLQFDYVFCCFVAYAAHTPTSDLVTLVLLLWVYSTVQCGRKFKLGK